MSQGFLKPALRGFAPYVPGHQPADGETWTKLNTNESPYPPSPRALEAAAGAVNDSLRLYPSPSAHELRTAIAEVNGIDLDRVVVGNGADELIAMCLRAFASVGDTVAFPWPSYPLLEPLCAIHQLQAARHELLAGWKWPQSLAEDRSPLKFLVNPNSPTGTWYPADAVEAIVAGAAGVVVLDEAYVDFAPESRLDLLERHRNLIILRTFSKSHALAGLRVGYGFAHPGLINALETVKDSYNLDRVAIAGAAAAVRDRTWRDHIVSRVVADREWFSTELAALDFEVAPSAANFVLVRPPDGVAAGEVQERLSARRILVRHFARAPLQDWLRITIGTRLQLESVVAALDEILREARP